MSIPTDRSEAPVSEVRMEKAEEMATANLDTLSKILDGKAISFNGGDSKQVEMLVRLYFRDTPILAEIAAG